MLYTANDDSDLRDWLWWAEDGGEAPLFVKTVAEAASIADLSNYALLRPVLLELMRQHPQPASSLFTD
jgi:hypothetical protein